MCRWPAGRQADSPDVSHELPDEVAARLDDWVAAQRRGDFSSYADLYHPAFFGIKRAGERKSEFDKRGWLDDRQPMFSSPKYVEVSNLSSIGDEDEAIVTFTQEWRSANFADKGPKVLVFKHENGQWRIVFEEMLASERID